MAVAASRTGGTLRAMHLSCRPLISRSSTLPDFIFMVRCTCEVLDVGLTATLNTSSFPLDMPPLMPPAWFV